MKTEELQKYIQNLSPDLYSFAYVLVPDDLQASQLMIDCVQSFLIQKKSLVERMGRTKNRIVKNLLNETKLCLFKIIFELKYNTDVIKKNINEKIIRNHSVYFLYFVKYFIYIIQ